MRRGWVSSSDESPQTDPDLWDRARTGRQCVRSSEVRFGLSITVERIVDEMSIPRLEVVRQELAREFGCDAEELALTRKPAKACTMSFRASHSDPVMRC